MKFQDGNSVRLPYCTMLDVCLPKRFETMYLSAGQIFPLVTFEDVIHCYFLLQFYSLQSLRSLHGLMPENFGPLGVFWGKKTGSVEQW